jgi:ribosomal protein S18 acetylase RimI-like enzyme
LIPFEHLTARPVAELTAAECAAAMERCFEGYIVPVRVTAESWERRFRGEHLDAFASRVYFHEDRPAAALFITRRGWTSRVAGMAVAKELRGSGVGRRVMQTAIDDARARGDHALLLEVIEQNTPAVKLYASLGFQVVRRLVGWRWTPPADLASADALREMDPAEVARIAQCEGEAELPWMLAPETLAAATAPARAFALEDRAFAVLSNPDAESVSVPALVVPRAHRRQGWGTRMLHALAADFPARTFQIVAIVPEELAPEFFVHVGCEHTPMTQFEMRLELPEASLPGL